jgi:hypothetical protein
VVDIPVSLPDLSEIDWGSSPGRTNKRITFKCSAPITDVKEQDLRATSFKFTQRVSIDVYVRAIKSEGLRLGREPDDLVAIEKWVTEYLALNRLSLENEGIQYVEILNAQTTPEVMGNEEIQQVWYHLTMIVALHYWLKATIVQ